MSVRLSAVQGGQSPWVWDYGGTRFSQEREKSCHSQLCSWRPLDGEMSGKQVKVATEKMIKKRRITSFYCWRDKSERGKEAALTELGGTFRQEATCSLWETVEGPRVLTCNWIWTQELQLVLTSPTEETSHWLALKRCTCTSSFLHRPPLWHHFSYLLFPHVDTWNNTHRKHRIHNITKSVGSE